MHQKRGTLTIACAAKTASRNAFTMVQPTTIRHLCCDFVAELAPPYTRRHTKVQCKYNHYSMIYTHLNELFKKVYIKNHREVFDSCAIKNIVFRFPIEPRVHFRMNGTCLVHDEQTCTMA